MSSPDLLFLGFCFLFFISYLSGSFRAAGAGGNFGRGREEFCIFMQFWRLPSQSQGACAPCASSPAGGAKCTCVNPGKVCGKAKPQKSSPYQKVFLCPRAQTWLSLRESWRAARKGGETERGASHVYGGGAATGGGEGQKLAPAERPNQKRKAPAFPSNSPLHPA